MSNGIVLKVYVFKMALLSNKVETFPHEAKTVFNTNINEILFLVLKSYTLLFHHYYCLA